MIKKIWLKIKTNRKLKKLWLKIKYNIFIDIDSSMFAKLGKGKFVSVFRKGDYLDIVDESSKDFVRLIPYQPNHGVMVEYHKKDSVNSSQRLHMDFKFFKNFLKAGEENK